MATNMRASDLRDQLTLQRATVAKDATGADVQTWADVATLWADVQPQAGREITVGSLTVPDVDLKIWLRYNADVLVTDRLVWNGAAYEIHAALDPEGRRIRTLVLASKVGP